MEKSISKAKIRFIVDAIEDIGGWLRILEKIMGKNVSAYAEQYSEEKILATGEAEKFYYTKELPKVREELKIFILENKEFAIEVQNRRKKEQEDLLEEKKQQLITLLKKSGDIELKEKLLNEAEKIDKQLRQKITQEMIENAREYPLENIIEIDQKGFSPCVNHQEKTPSMYCKKNYAHCFGCGWTGDSIDVYRKVSGAGFEEAVKFLCNIFDK